MKYAIAEAVVVAASVGLLVAGCSSPKPNPAACKAAMAQAYLTTLRNPSAPPAAEPSSCHGVPTSTVSQYATQIMGGQH